MDSKQLAFGPYSMRRETLSTCFWSGDLIVEGTTALFLFRLILLALGAALMDTLAEIVAAARHLAPSRLTELRQEIEQLEKESRAIRFEARDTGGMACRLIRLADGEFAELQRRSLAIQDPLLMVYVTLSAQSAPLRLSQPATYLTLKHLVGESGCFFDDYKCSFSFPFALQVEREERTYPYLFEVRNYGGGLEFPIRRVVDERDERLADQRIHEPFEEELGAEEIRCLVLRFVGYLMGVWQVILKRRQEPFVQTVRKNLLVFGCHGGKVFEKWYEREGSYLSALRRHEDQVRVERQSAATRMPRRSIGRSPRQRR
jgi:hypothetical protein